MSTSKPGLKSGQRYLLERVAREPVYFTHAVDIKGRATRLVRSSISSSQQKVLHELALAGYVAEVVTGCGGHGSPPESTVTYTVTALGHEAAGLHKPTPRPVNRAQPLTDAELAAEGIE